MDAERDREGPGERGRDEMGGVTADDKCQRAGRPRPRSRHGPDNGFFLQQDSTFYFTADSRHVPWGLLESQAYAQTGNLYAVEARAESRGAKPRAM